MTGAPTAGYRREPGAAVVRDAGAAARDRLRPEPRSAAAARHRRSATSTGATVRLGEYFGTRPVVLVFVYYECPMLCTQVLNALTSALGVLSLEPGKDFEVVTGQLRSARTPALAAAQEGRLPAALQAAGRRRRLAFSDRRRTASIERLTKAAGFRYVWDEQTKQFAHPTGIIVLTPDGRLARYLFGIEYGPRDCGWRWSKRRPARSASAVDSLLLYCYHYDPMTGRYGLVDHARDPPRRRRHRARARRVHRSSWCGASVERRNSEPAADASRLTPAAMWSGTPLFPEAASTMAAPRRRAVFLSASRSRRSSRC